MAKQSLVKNWSTCFFLLKISLWKLLMTLGINGLALIRILFLLIAPDRSFGQKLMGDYHQIMIAAL
jgi:hypothetical protein